MSWVIPSQVDMLRERPSAPGNPVGKDQNVLVLSGGRQPCTSSAYCDGNEEKKKSSKTHKLDLVFGIFQWIPTHKRFDELIICLKAFSFFFG